jgi:aryl-alcohol dehydrogenase-like predicted oxidoreductase
VALAWLLSQPQVVVIPGASSVEQLEFNVAAADLELDPDSVAALTAAATAFDPVSAFRTLLDAARRRVGR